MTKYRIHALFFLAVIFLLSAGCRRNKKEEVTFPYSQWIVGTGSKNITWEYPHDLDLNASFIAAPDSAEWTAWYDALTAYRKRARRSMGRTPPRLRFDFPGPAAARTHFDKIGYDLVLEPGTPLRVEGRIRDHTGMVSLSIRYDLKNRGEARS